MTDVPRPVGGPLAGVRALALATHLGPTVAVTTVATLLAVSAGVPGGHVVLVALAVLAGQASIGWSNDWLDADRDRQERADRGDGNRRPQVRGEGQRAEGHHRAAGRSRHIGHAVSTPPSCITRPLTCRFTARDRFVRQSAVVT